jgi:uncharacterized protein YjbJ (UPF0337 family)
MWQSIVQRYGTYRGGAEFCLRLTSNGEWNMDKEHIKGAADKAKGAVKDTVGKMTGDTKMQAEGKVDKAKGTAHNVAGDVKDAARDATDND